MGQENKDYQNLLTEIIKKLTIIYGPTIILAKVKNNKNISVSDQGVVTSISNDPLETTHQIINDLTQLSEEIVKNAINPIISNYPAISTQLHTKYQTPTEPLHNDSSKEASIDSTTVQDKFSTQTSNTPPTPIPAPIPLQKSTNQSTDMSLNNQTKTSDIDTMSENTNQINN